MGACPKIGSQSILGTVDRIRDRSRWATVGTIALREFRKRAVLAGWAAAGQCVSDRDRIWFRSTGVGDSIAAGLSTDLNIAAAIDTIGDDSGNECFVDSQRREDRFCDNRRIRGSA